MVVDRHVIEFFPKQFTAIKIKQLLSLAVEQSYDFHSMKPKSNNVCYSLI